VVLKRARVEDYRPEDADSWPAQGLFRDWAGLQFLGETAGEVTGCPRFYGGDRDAGFVLMEDLGTGESLADRLLHGTAQNAEEGLLLLAGVLGRMHAATSGREEEYLRVRGALSSWEDPDRVRMANGVRESRQKTEEACAAIGVPVGPAFAADVETIARALESPGPFLAYTHGDPCPDNTLVKGDGLRLFDYEFGGYRHALVDGVYGRIRFPTCWCVGEIPEPVVERMEAAYRQEWASVYPAVGDDGVYGRAITEACGSWLLGHFGVGGTLPKVLEKDDTWGIATIRQRLVKRLGVIADLTEKYRHLTGLRDVSLGILERVEARWKGETADLPLYPAFARGLDRE
jgi:hypothetical protein